MLQPPLLPPPRVGGPFQRDRKPQGQYGIQAAKGVSSAICNVSWQSKRTLYTHFIARGGNSQLRTTVRVGRILTQSRLFERYPGVFELTITTEHRRRKGGHTCMRTKDSWVYSCRATIARKYIVTSVAIVRTTAESLSTLKWRNVHQATTRKADRSKCFP